MLHSNQQSLNTRLADRALLFALKTLRALLRPWPMPLKIRFGGWAGMAAGRASKRRSLALNNLKRAFGKSGRYDRRQLERFVDHSYRDMGRSMMEFLMSEAIDSAYFTEHVDVENEACFRNLIAEKKGIVLLTAHFGNWEFLNLMAGVRGHALAVLAKPQKLAATDAYLNRLRTSRGAQVVVRGMDVRRVYRTLEQGGLAGVLADQDGGADGIFAPLFGRSSSYPRGVARFSYKTGAPALPVFAVRRSLDRHRIHVGSPVRVQEGESEDHFENRVVTEFSRQLEAMVRLEPSQWLWAHRRWKSSPDRDILVLDDGRKGHTHQSQALANKVAERRSRGLSADLTRIRTLEVKYRSAAARAALTLYGILTRGRLWNGMRWLRWTLTPECYQNLSTAPADTVISCGTSTEAVNLIAARDCGARSCYIQKPQFGARYFSAILVPGHDRLKAGRNTLKTRGALSFVHPERLRLLRDRARAEAGITPGARAAALLIGGPSKHSAWNPSALENIFMILRDFSRERKLYLLVTTSRRTDPAVESTVERLFVGEPTCPVIVIPTRSNPSHAYEGILAAADLVLVTTDSVSMISEAVATGKPVGLIDPSGGLHTRRGKIGRFLKELERDGLAVRLTPGSINTFLSQRISADAPADSADAVRSAAELLAS